MALTHHKSWLTIQLRSCLPVKPTLQCRTIHVSVQHWMKVAIKRTAPMMAAKRYLLKTSFSYTKNIGHLSSGSSRSF